MPYGWQSYYGNGTYNNGPYYGHGSLKAPGTNRCEIDGKGDQVCYYAGPPAKDGKHAHRVYVGECGKDGQVFDHVIPPKHGRDAQCNDKPILTWEKDQCPSKPTQFYIPSCPGKCPSGISYNNHYYY